MFRWTSTAVILIAAGLMLCTGASSLRAQEPGVYARIDIDALGREPLRQLKETPGLAWWIELDDQLLVLAGESTLANLARSFAVERLAPLPRPSRLYLLRGARRDDLEVMEADVLASGGRFAVIQARQDQKPALPHLHGEIAFPHQAHADLLPFEPNLVLARQYRRESAAPRLSAAARAWIDEVDEQRWFNSVSALASFNRYTRGPGVDDARDWIVAQLQALGGLTVETESFQVGATTAYNVIATLPGTERPEEIYIVGAHYDAISPSPQTAAPGAEDNASGCAGVLEIARILTARPPAATVLFICFSGEEQGLFGSADHASRLVSSGLDSQVKLVLNMDMIGFTEDADLDCLLETSSAHAALLDIFAAAAGSTQLRILTSLFPFGSDHVPYLSRGMPAVLTIENDWDSYPCYHSTCDLPAEVDLAMGREVLKMNLAALAEMIGVEDPIFADGFEAGNLSQWSVQVP